MVDGTPTCTYSGVDTCGLSLLGVSKDRRADRRIDRPIDGWIDGWIPPYISTITISSAWALQCGSAADTDRTTE